eukprot:scaffold297367_cov35-Tisochrysis_lutea.AAC.2
MHLPPSIDLFRVGVRTHGPQVTHQVLTLSKFVDTPRAAARRHATCMLNRSGVPCRHGGAHCPARDQNRRGCRTPIR